jgi:carbamoyltransferase
MYILGISCFYHDAAACILKDGEVMAAAQEERFTRVKHDSDFPKNAIDYCLRHTSTSSRDLDYIGFYDKPITKFMRILETYTAVAPRGVRSFLVAVPIWLRDKLWMRDLIKKKLDYDGEIIFTEHHQSHAASAFFASPFEESAILTVDGVGEWATAACGIGQENQITLTHEIRFPHSLGLLYSAFTYYLGFKVNSGEYKVMGASPYGEPKYYDVIMENLVDVKDDGSFKLNMSYFAYTHGLKMINKKFEELFGFRRREPEAKIEKHHFDIAMSIQRVTEEIMLRMANNLYEKSGMKNLCLAGGVALNSVANGRILRETPFKEIFIQPAAGDAGGAMGVASFIYFTWLDNKRDVRCRPEKPGIVSLMKTAYLGPEFPEDEIKKFLDENGAVYEWLDRGELLKRAAGLLADGNIIGWFQGRMEWGPRALGNRSILADPRDAKMKDILNKKVKHRESFRPFAPTILLEKVSEYFELDCSSPYMLIVARVKKDNIPAVTHVDGSARFQTVARDENPLYYDLIKEFYKLTDVPVLLNTSFNVRGEPIVCTPEDGYKCFMRAKMDYLVMGPFMMDRKDQKPLEEDIVWQKKFESD